MYLSIKIYYLHLTKAHTYLLFIFKEHFEVQIVPEHGMSGQPLQKDFMHSHRFLK